jgi:hypothetical protein
MSLREAASSRVMGLRFCDLTSPQTCNYHFTCSSKRCANMGNPNFLESFFSPSDNYQRTMTSSLLGCFMKLLKTIKRPLLIHYSWRQKDFPKRELEIMRSVYEGPAVSHTCLSMFPERLSNSKCCYFLLQSQQGSTII